MVVLHAVLRAAARRSSRQSSSSRQLNNLHLPAASTLLLVTMAGWCDIKQDNDDDEQGIIASGDDVRNVGSFGGIGNNRYWATTARQGSVALCQQQSPPPRQHHDNDIGSGGSNNVPRNDLYAASSGNNYPPPPQSSSSIVPSPFRNFVATSSAYLDLRIQRAVTSKRMAAEKSRRTFFSVYEVKFDDPLGSGAYGDVYLCRERSTGEECALKKIPKEFTDREEFAREMNTLLHIRANGGHPNICMLRENFDEEDDYMLVFDLVDGGEMFEHLIKHGAYSEADASRLLRQVASALDFIHGIGVVHAGKLLLLCFFCRHLGIYLVLLLDPSQLLWLSHIIASLFMNHLLYLLHRFEARECHVAKDTWWCNHQAH